MSGLWKGIKKVFKKVVSSASKFLPAVLAIGAVVFTAGAALGLAPLAMGWGGAVSSLVGSTGITGTLGSVLTGAVTQAGYGAAIGGAIGSVTGQGFSAGAGMGALAGAATGGVTGGLGFGTDPLAGAFKSPAGVTQAGTAASGVTGAAPGLGAAGAPAVAGGALPAAPAVAGVTAPAAAAPGLGGFGSSLLASPVVGSVIGGVGQGLMAGMAAKDANKADEKRFNQIRDSYKVSSDSLYGKWKGDPTQRPTPGQRYGTTKFAYNKDSGQIEEVAG